MTREEIERLKDSIKPFEGTRKDWYEIGCLDGLAVADAEPNLESLWHDVIEPPKLGEWFLAQIGNIAFDTFIMAMNKNEDWKEWSNGINIKRWAYISDLLPKGSKK